MSYSKRQFEEDDDSLVRPDTPAEIAENNRGWHADDVADDDCTCNRPDCDKCYFTAWACEMVGAEVSRGMLDGMWDRIKIKLDDLGKVEQVIADVWGHRTWMVER